ncbi:MAG: flavin reductase family protein [Nocardioides sp.]|nr:flavin reductase family protein [Nocardioides sp.]
MDLDEFVDGLDYPMYVVTTALGDERSGCLVGFGTQVSIDPARFLVCISQANHTHALVLEADHVAVHLLRADQHDVAELFGGETGDDVDKFEHCAWSPGPQGVPVLDDCARVLVGHVIERHDLGDHTGLLLEPVAQEAREGEPGLTFQQVEHIDPGHDA